MQQEVTPRILLGDEAVAPGFPRGLRALDERSFHERLWR
jgi:hypothetical protein